MVDGRATSSGRKRPRAAIMPVVDGAGAGAGAESGTDSREISDAAAGDKALQQENINDYQVSSMLGASLQQMKVCKYVNIGWQGLRIPCLYDPLVSLVSSKSNWHRGMQTAAQRPYEQQINNRYHPAAVL